MTVGGLPGPFLRARLDAPARRAQADLAQALEHLRPSAVPCRTVADPSAWTSEDPAEIAEAVEACSRCPVLDLCRRFGRRAHLQSGVFGGESGNDRIRTYLADPRTTAHNRKKATA